jgi:TolB protein
VSAAVSHSVTLNWVASTSPNIAGYNIYRGTTSMSGPFGAAPLNSALITGLTYVDTTVVAGTTYYYVATAVNTSGVQSGDSSPISATVP